MGRYRADSPAKLARVETDEATAAQRRQNAASTLEGDYYSRAWYLRRLDEVQLSAERQGKHPAAVSALRTMAELAGLIGPPASLVDARVQVLALPAGLSEQALIALASGWQAPPAGDTNLDAVGSVGSEATAVELQRADVNG